MMSPPSLSLFLLFTIILCQHVPYTYGFAAWLKCYVDLDDTEIIMNHPVQNAEDVVSQTTLWEVKLADDKEWSTPSEFAEMTSMLEDIDDVAINLRLLVDSKKKSKYGMDVQYVAEIVDEDSDSKFVKGVCEGRRAVGRNEEAITITVNGPTTVIAGWATGHEAVKLTYPIKLFGDDEEEDEL